MRNGAGFVGVMGWEEFSWLRAGFSYRSGGGSTTYSGGEIGEQNLGWTAEDDAAVVAENRRRFVECVGGEDAFELVTVRQVHGAIVQRVVRGGGELSTAEGKAVLQGDGLMTSERGMMLGVQTADCVPVLIADTRTRVVAAIHAGWRGTLARIVEGAVGAMGMEFGSRREDLVAAVGPAIGPCCFEVGKEVQAEFEREFGYGSKLFGPSTEAQIRMNLWEANRRQLVDAGVMASAISVVGECTACTRLESGRRKYFSHRAEQGLTGRMLSVIGMVGS